MTPARSAAVETVREAWAVWRDADGARLGAALAFYTTLSMAPFFVLVVAVAGVFLGDDAARRHLITEASNIIGPAAADLIDQALAQAGTGKGRGLAAAIGLGTLLIGATATFTELRSAVCAIFGEAAARMPVLAALRTRALALALAIATGFLLVISLVVSAMVAAWISWLGGTATVRAGATAALSEIAAFVLIGVAFTSLIKALPVRRVPWRAAALGGFSSAALFAVGKYAIGAYVGRVVQASAYGAAAALIVVMLWVYYSAQIFLIGVALARARSMRADAPRVASSDVSLMVPNR